MIREGTFFLGSDLPIVLGSEVAGVVEAVGPDVDGIRPGARVASLRTSGCAVTRGYAEYALLDADFIADVPEDLSCADAVAL